MVAGVDFPAFTRTRDGLEMGGAPLWRKRSVAVPEELWKPVWKPYGSPASQTNTGGSRTSCPTLNDGSPLPPYVAFLAAALSYDPPEPTHDGTAEMAARFAPRARDRDVGLGHGRLRDPRSTELTPRR